MEGGDTEEKAWRGEDEDTDAVGDGGLGEVFVRNVEGAPQESTAKNNLQQCNNVRNITLFF